MAGTTGGTSGGSFTGSFGGTPSTVAGTFGTITAGMTAGGMLSGGASLGGMPVAGMPSGGIAEAGMAGANDDECQLSTTDCYTAHEPECAGVRMECQGQVLNHGLVWSTNRAHMSDLATAVDGRVAMVGSFLGLLNVDDSTLPAVSDDYDGFALVFDSERNLLWSHFFGGAGAQVVTGVDFAPGGDVVVQGSDDTTGSAFVTRLDQQGKTVWSFPLGKTDMNPGALGVDNDGYISLVGGFKDALEYRGDVRNITGYGSYVVRLFPDGDLHFATVGAPFDWKSAAATKLAVDDEDNLGVLGHGTFADDTAGGYFEKVSSGSSSVYVREIAASKYVEAGAVAVDRKMQNLVGGAYRGDLRLGDFSHSSQNELANDLWLAKLGRDGAWEWFKTMAGSGDGTSTLGAIATDPSCNIVTAASDGDQVQVTKHREDGLEVWTTSFATSTPSDVRLASDNTGNMWLAANFTKSFDYGDGVVKAQGNSAIMLLQLSR